MKVSFISVFVVILLFTPVLADGLTRDCLSTVDNSGQDHNLSYLISSTGTGSSRLVTDNLVGLAFSSDSGDYVIPANLKYYSTSIDKRVLRVISLGLTAASIGASTYFYLRSNYYYDQYLTATQIDEIQEYYSLAQTPRYISLVFLGLGVVIIGYNVLDIFLTTDNISSQALFDRLENFGSKTVSLGPEGIRVRF